MAAFSGSGYAVVELEGVSGPSEAVSLPGFPDKTVQAAGTGTVSVQGSLDGTNWYALNDHAGVAIALDATAFEAAIILENTLYIRANVATGTANVTIVCTGRGR